MERTQDLESKDVYLKHNLITVTVGVLNFYFAYLQNRGTKHPKVIKDNILGQYIWKHLVKYDTSPLKGPNYAFFTIISQYRPVSRHSRYAEVNISKIYLFHMKSYLSNVS